ncbi:hemolysin type calcium-binding protein [Stackebrandtia albiflava]|uniref:Hemolysin type calcium-binding protein n=1 Tax=Stackebrandtia albiflava TaxID=406432 RepID=A0A562V2Z6_9ACTN|nr:M91 family zinc metallopeptidase [Stackebrandtia albiflava]TWJ12228.1 hemolysin type calcium-binding protein [Stackebrandtia albiflava]
MPQPTITVAADVFDLDADPAAIESAADAWRAAGPKAATAAASLRSAANNAYDDPWTGAARDSHEGFVGRVCAGLAEFPGNCDTVAAALTEAAAVLRDGQRALTALKQEITAIAPMVGGGFQPADAAGTALVKDKIEEARKVREGVETALSGMIIGKGVDWATLSASIGTFQGPKGTGEVGLIGLPDGGVVVNVNGPVALRRNEHGDTVVEVQGELIAVPQGSSILLNGGGGADRITIADGVVPVTVLGNDGDDEIHGGSGEDVVYGGAGDDELYGGKGRDHVYGGDGRDYIDGQDGHDVLSGGKGDDVVYGLDGNDRIDGGDGRDYLEGAAGDDSLDGGDGKDVVSGGRGDDHVRGGDGDDVLYTGHGRDRVDGGHGHDTAHYQKGQDTVSAETRKHVTFADHSFVTFADGTSEEFEDRIEADLDMLAGSTTGSTMLNELKGLTPGHEMRIGEFDRDNGTARWYNGQAGDAPGPHIEINPEYQGGQQDRKPPVAVLYHEMAHGYGYLSGEMDRDPHVDPEDPDLKFDEKSGKWVPVPNHERQAVGLPIDHDSDSTTTYEIDPRHRFALTENALRQEMGLGPREHYGRDRPPR